MLAYSPVKAQDCAGKVGVHTFMTSVLRGVFLVRRWLANNHSFRKKKNNFSLTVSLLAV